ncbi:Uncharacterised protein [Vibrio cholerae]|nr:Uncharacterised protein [Vibrio cholerae]CSI90167.1 Uncharacterised protein [Vibrio cholerae]
MRHHRGKAEGKILPLHHRIDVTGDLVIPIGYALKYAPPIPLLADNLMAYHPKHSLFAPQTQQAKT